MPIYFWNLIILNDPTMFSAEDFQIKESKQKMTNNYLLIMIVWMPQKTLLKPFRNIKLTKYWSQFLSCYSKRNLIISFSKVKREDNLCIVAPCSNNSFLFQQEVDNYLPGNLPIKIVKSFQLCGKTTLVNYISNRKAGSLL